MRKPFVLDSASQRSRMKEYQPMEDVHLYNFFGSPVVRKTLRKGGLVTNKGEVIQHTYNPRAPKIILPPLAFVTVQPKTAGAFTFGHTKQTASSGRLGSKPEIPDRIEEPDKVKTLDRKSGSMSDLSKPRESRKRATAGETAKKRSWESSSLKPLSHEEYETMLQRFVIPEEGAQQAKAVKKTSSSAIASPSRKDEKGAKERGNGAQVLDRPRVEEAKKKPQEEQTQRIEKPKPVEKPAAKVEKKPMEPKPAELAPQVVSKPAEITQQKVDKPKNAPKPAEVKPKVESPRADVKKPVGSPKAAPAQPEKPAAQPDNRPKESPKAENKALPQMPEEQKITMPKTEVQQVEVVKADEPRVEKAAEVPKKEAPEAEAPIEEAPKAELPKVEEAKVELPKAEIKAESPRTEAPKAEAEPARSADDKQVVPESTAPVPSVEEIVKEVKTSTEQVASPEENPAIAEAVESPKASEKIHEGAADSAKESEPAKAIPPPEELKPSAESAQKPEPEATEEPKPAVEPPSEDSKPVAEPAKKLDSQAEPPVYNAEVPVLQAAPSQPSEA